MKRVITIVLAMAMALSVCSVAYADDKIRIADGQEDERFKEIDGNVNVSVSIENTTPNDAYLRVIPCHTAFIPWMIEVGAFITKFSPFTKNEITMSKSLWNIKLFFVFL